MQMRFFLGHVICKTDRPRGSKHGGDVSKPVNSRRFIKSRK